MQINTQLAKAFNKAVTNVENIDATQEDGINWNFVDADCYMDLSDINSDLTVGSHIDYIDQFNYLADCYTGKITLADRLVQTA